MLWSLPLVPLVSAILIAALRGKRGSASVAFGALVLTVVAALLASANQGNALWPWSSSTLALQLGVEGFARLMCVLVPSIAVVIILYAIASPEGEDDPGRLLALLVAFTGAMELLVLAQDFLTLLVGWELVGACSWALVGYEWRDAARVRSARNAFITTRTGDLGLYAAAAATYTATGSLRFATLADVHGPLLGMVAAGVILAATAKSAQLPFAPWLFSAMAGPTAASALLHSATMVAAGAFLLARLAPVLTLVTWFGPIVAAVGVMTALAGGIVASLQSDLKKVLAASTSAQYGLMFVAIGAGLPGAAEVHLVTHAVFKALLFLGAGVASHAAGTLALQRLDRTRLGSALPRVAIFFGAGTLALAGVPPLGAAFSKDQILAAAGRAPFSRGMLEVGVVVAAVLSAFYATRLQLSTFARHGGLEVDRSRVARPTLVQAASLGVLAITCVALGILWTPPAQHAFERATTATLAPQGIGQLPLSIGMAILGIGAAWVLSRSGLLVTVGIPERMRGRAEDWLGIPALAERIMVRPVLVVAHFLSIVDSYLVDAGIRATARVATIASRAFAWWGERGLDGIVNTIARLTGDAAQVSSRIDDAAIDGAVEIVARDVGRVGHKGRDLQSGVTHWYYVLVALGTLAAVLVAAAAVVLRRR